MSDDRHTPRNERKPKPVKLPAAPWEGAQGGKARETTTAPPVGATAPQRPGEWQQ